MRAMKRFPARTACITGAFCACLSQPTVGAQPAPATAAAAAPAACTTKQRIEPRTAGWAFVVNFETFDNSGAPVGCLVVYRIPRRATDFVPVSCKVNSNGADLAFSAGRASFAGGGYLYCEMNVKTTLASLNPPIAANDVEQYPYFTLIGVGTLSDTISVSNIYDNPIAYYAPITNTQPDVGLFVPISANGGQIHSRFNNTNNLGAFQNAGTLAANTQYTFTVEHDGVESVLTTTTYLDEARIDAFSPRGPVAFWTNGGRFYVGYTPLGGGRFLKGTFEEVIFDPPDGGRPPTRQLGVVYDVWLPLLAR
jgi:hypothetical protein